MSLLKISTDQIAVDYSPRRNQKGQEELKASIEREGRLLDPISVRPDGDRFVIIDGLRRFQIVQELGWTEIECIVEDVNEITAAHLSYVKNAERKNLNPIEIALHLQHMKEHYDYNVQDLVRLGYAPHRSTLDNYLHLLELPEDVQDKIAAGEIPATTGYHLYRLKNPELQQKVADEVAEKGETSTRRVKNKVDALIASTQQPEEQRDPNIPEGELPGVYFKDSRDMSELEDESVHLILTSPPYGVGLEYEADVSLAEHFEMKNAVFNECARVLIPGGIIFLNFTDIHNYGSRQGGAPETVLVGSRYQEMLKYHGIRLTDTVIWEKPPNWVNNPQVSYSEKILHTSWRFLHNTEHIYIFRKDGQRLVSVDKEYESKLPKEDWKNWVTGIWKINPVSRQEGHPAQFPEELVQRAIKMFSYKGDVVLDPFLGSGTTVKVANELSRVGIGYERDEKYKGVIMRKLGMEDEEINPAFLPQYQQSGTGPIEAGAF